jgi:hypothetical protein
MSTRSLRASWQRLRWQLSLLPLLLAACASGPQPPVWQANAHAALAAHSRAYLNGDERSARQALLEARREVARTGQAEPLARVELTACAAQLASLATLADSESCPAFVPLAQDVGPALRTYADYLAGRWTGLDSTLLPEAQRGVPAAVAAVTAAATDPVALLNGMADPLSRLLAAASLLRAGQLSPAGIALAIDTAAAQGWRRPLLAWLGLEQLRLERAGDVTAAAARQRQRERILQSP